MTHEQIIEALFAWLIAQTTGFETFSRRLQHWNKTNAQPALFLCHTGTTDEYDGDLPITTIDCEIWIYSNSGKDPNVAPDIELNVLAQSVRAAFTPDDDNRFTLNHTVYWARTEGRSVYYPGDQGVQAIAHIPVRITIP